MAGIMEQQRPINDSEDYVVAFQCGCNVRFLGETFHRTSRMDPCFRHAPIPDTESRAKILADARRQLAQAKLSQPPR